MAEKIPDMAGAPAAKAIPIESGRAMSATLMAAIKSLCQFSIKPSNSFFRCNFHLFTYPQAYII